MQINIDKQLINLANRFLKPTNDVSHYINYREHDSFLTDGHKLLAIPNSYPMIANSKESLAVTPIFNWVFYKKYSAKKCTIEVDTKLRCYQAVLDNELIASADVGTHYPDCDSVLSYYNYNLDFTIGIPAGIYSRLDIIQSAIKEYNAKQKVKQQPLYNLDNATVVFNTYYEDGFTYIRAEADLADDVLTDQVKDSLCVLKGTVPKDFCIKETYRGEFNLFRLSSCLDALERLAGSNSFNLNISFDTNKTTAPIKLSLDSGAWCILMPTIRKK